jgi:biopolymer transport protein ExbD
MATRFHRANQRRKELGQSSLGHGGINLVPLVDILTSIVFFSLLTYQGALMANLTTYDLSLPPMVVSAPTAKGDNDQLNLLLAVRVSTDRMLVEHSAEGGFRREIIGLDSASLDTLQSLMEDIKRKYPQNNDVLVIPSDDVAYNDVIHVLERLKIATYQNVALGTRERSQPVNASAVGPGATAAGAGSGSRS